MTAYTLAARESVQVIRESLASIEPMANVLKADLDVCLEHLATVDDSDYESIELWARLAADIAGMIQQRQKA